jgi:hypothetical protein
MLRVFRAIRPDVARLVQQRSRQHQSCSNGWKSVRLLTAAPLIDFVTTE